MVRDSHRLAFLPLLLLAACSSQQDKQLEAVKSARSVAAEWAEVELLASSGKLSSAYAGEMRDQANAQLQSELKSLPAESAHAVDFALRTSSADALVDAQVMLSHDEKQLAAQ